MTTYTESELYAAVQAGYHAPDDLPLATRSWIEGYRAGRSNTQPVVTNPIAAVRGWFHGECVIQALDPEAVLPAGMALYAAPQPVVPEGYVLVPVEPTEKMIAASLDYNDYAQSNNEGPEKFNIDIYKAMISVSDGRQAMTRDEWDALVVKAATEADLFLEIDVVPILEFGRILRKSLLSAGKETDNV